MDKADASEASCKLSYLVSEAASEAIWASAMNAEAADEPKSSACESSVAASDSTFNMSS